MIFEQLETNQSIETIVLISLPNPSNKPIPVFINAKQAIDKAHNAKITFSRLNGGVFREGFIAVESLSHYCIDDFGIAFERLI